MNQNKKVGSFLLFLISVTFLLQACSKDKTSDDTDRVLYLKAKETNGFTWFNHSDTLLERSSGSGHSQPYLRTRYNTLASTVLGTNGKILPNAVFPEGSLIVKELYSDSVTLGRYAILYKETDHPDADARGWVWGYINTDGTVASPAKDKGGTCISCHSQTDNIDYMLMNKYFP